MVLYFSGTGNSEYVAQRIAKAIGDDTINIANRIKTGEDSKIQSDKPYVIVAPTYAWQLPQLVRDWLLKASLTGNKDIFFVLTCGGSIGGAGHFVKKLADSLGMNYKGIAQVVMPDNYIVMFTAPDKKEAVEIIDKAETVIDNIASDIAAGNMLETGAGIFKVLFTTFMNWGFYKQYVNDKKFVVKDSCTGCGLCAEKCPKNNIAIEGGRPVWKGDCTHCMACICSCPSEAIECGKHSIGQPRYKCPKKCE